MKKIIIMLITLSSFLASAQASERVLEQEDLLYLTTNDGTAVILLNSTFAPKSVAQIKKIVRADGYKNASFYRVIEGFVAQGGLGDQAGDYPTLLMENSVPLEQLNYVVAQTPDMYADSSGFVDGFAAASDGENVWLAHCPGVMGLGRNNEPDTATTEFYFPIGQAPRYLDNIMAIIGRVVYGMDVIQSVNRAPTTSGIFENLEGQTLITGMAIGSDLPKEEQLPLALQRTDTAEFKEYIESIRHRTNAFFYNKPPAVVDVCLRQKYASVIAN